MKCIGWQIVQTGTDNPPCGMYSYQVYDLDFCMAWLSKSVRSRYRLLPVFEGDIDNPTFVHNEPPGRHFRVVFNVQGYVVQTLRITDPRVTQASLERGLKNGTILTTIHNEGREAEVYRVGKDGGLKPIGYVAVISTKTDLEYSEWEAEEKK